MKTVPILMPQMGQSVAEGTILRWEKNVGDIVAMDEIIVEVETDKTSVEVESSVGGKVASCLKQVGEIAAAGEIIGYIETEDEFAMSEETATLPSGDGDDKYRPHAADSSEGQITVTAKNFNMALNGDTLPEIDSVSFSPYVSRLAVLNGVSLQELESIPGSGRNGRVTKRDLLNYLARRPVGAVSVSALAGKLEVSDEDLSSLGQVVPMTAIRRTIADHMVQSIHTSPHVTMVHAVDMTRIVDMRDEFKTSFEEINHARFTYTAVMIYVISRVLPEFPVINSSVHGTNIIMRNDVNIGCAVAVSDESLVVPVVRRADTLSFAEICKALARMIAKARKRELSRNEVEGGTFTISNFGSFGSLIGTPIINQPQVAILGMGAIYKAPVVIESEIHIRDQLYLSLSFDHRVIDGALGGQFLNSIQQTTESLSAESLDLSD